MAKPLKKLNDHDLLVAAFTAMQTNQFILAIKHFKEVLRRDPGDPFAYCELAKCYFSTDDPDEALINAKKAFQMAKRDAEILLAVANTCQLTRNYKLALEVLKSAESHPNLRHAALVRQAEIYELSNQLEAAEDALSAAGGESTQAFRAIQAKLFYRRGEYKKAKDELQKLITNASEDNFAFISSLQYQLAEVLDKIGEFKDASIMLERAKLFHKGTDAYKLAERGRKGIIATLSGLCDQLDKATLNKWQQEAEIASASSPSPYKQSFLLGHPRSGTTLIEQALDAHPQVISADETSLFHNTIWMPTVLKGGQMKASFSDYIDNLTKNSIRQARRDYNKHWERSILSKQSASHTHLLDKNPALTTRLAMIARFYPEASIVFALRDPRDVVISSYMQPVGLNDWSINWLTIKDTVDYYCFTMQMWLDIRDQLTNPWVEVRYEDCVNDFSSQAQKVTRSLGLEWHPNQENIQSHVNRKVVYSPTYADVGKAVYSSSIGRWKNYTALIEPYLNQLKPYIEAFGYSEKA